MTDDTDETTGTTDASGSAPQLDDPYEVKWRKKEPSGSSPLPDIERREAVEEGATIEELRRRLEEAERRATDLQDRWHRGAADLSNLRKRTEQDRGDMERFASMMLVAELLPVLDNFERALATVPGNLALLTWIQGIMLIERHLRALLEHQGLASIEAGGQQFNPHFHEAIAEQATDESPPGTVLRVLQKGYTMHDRVIRPALVELAAPAVETEPAISPAPTPDEERTEDIVEEAETENTGP